MDFFEQKGLEIKVFKCNPVFFVLVFLCSISDMMYGFLIICAKR